MTTDEISLGSKIRAGNKQDSRARMSRDAYRRLSRCLLLPFLLSLVSTGFAQEVEADGKSSGAIFSPADYLQIITPVTRRVTVSAYGFYLGNVHSSIALLEVPVTLQRHFVVTPGYLFVNVPPGGLSLLTGQTANHSFHENQFRCAATVLTSWHGFTLSDRNMYVRRFTPTSELNRYRNKIYVSHALSLGSYKVTPFVFDEIYHDFVPGKWLRRNWIVAALDMPINRHLTFQPSYIRQDDQYLRSVNFLGLALIIRTNPLFESKPDRKNASANAAVEPETPTNPTAIPH
jgi:hypothetical protein